MAVVLRKKFDLLSLLPRLESHSFWESLLVPLAASAASSMYMIALTNAAYMTKTAFANGQFMLMSRKAYDAFGGHERVKDRYCEDVEIARLLKTSGFRPRVLVGQRVLRRPHVQQPRGHLPRVEPDLLRGAGRQPLAESWRPRRSSFSAASAATSALAFGLTALGDGRVELAPGIWVIGAIVHLSLMTGCLATLYRWSGNPRRNAFLFPARRRRC